MWRTWRGDTSSSPLRATLAWLRLNIKVQFNLVNDILNVCCDGLLWRETLLAIWNVDRENGWVSGTVPLCWYCVAFFNVEKTFRLPRHRWVDQTLFHLSNRIGRAALLQLQQWTGGRHIEPFLCDSSFTRGNWLHFTPISFTFLRTTGWETLRYFIDKPRIGLMAPIEGFSLLKISREIQYSERCPADLV